MAGSPRNGNSQWWTAVSDLALASQAAFTDIWTNGINRVSDRTVWLRDRVTQIYSDLGNATAGTRATVTGSVDLSTLAYDPVTGDLNGKVLVITGDAGGAYTVTFGTGAGAPAGPSDVVAQILAVASAHHAAVEDAAGHLNLASTTTGGTSTETVTSGSAVTPLGFTNGQTASGVSTGADGISRVSGAAVTGTGMTLPGGTLRAMLQYVADNASAAGIQVAAYSGASFTIAAGSLQTFLRLLADKAAKLDGTNTFSGANTFSDTTTFSAATGIHVTQAALVDGALGVGGSAGVTNALNVGGLATLGAGANVTGTVAATTVTATGHVGAGTTVGAGTDLAANHNVIVGSTATLGGGDVVLALAPAGTIPTVPPAGIVLYVDGSGNLKALTSGGNTRTIAAV